MKGRRKERFNPALLLRNKKCFPLMLSKCHGINSITITREIVRMQVFRSHPGPTESEKLGKDLASCVSKALQIYSDARSSLGTAA